MKRDYSKFIDEAYKNDHIGFAEHMENEIKKTIEEDDIDDAVKNIMELIFETKYEW